MTNKYKLVPIEPSDKKLQKMQAFALNVELSHDYTWNDYMRELYAIATSEAAPPADVEPVAIVEPNYNDQAMGCGLEDRNITDRYEAMAYGWECAINRMFEQIPDTPLYTQPPADKDAERYRWLCTQQDTSAVFIMGKYASKEGSYGDFSCEKINIDEAIDKAMGEV